MTETNGLENLNLSETENKDDFSFLRNMLSDEYTEPLPNSSEEYVDDIRLYFPKHRLFDRQKTSVVVKHMLRMLDELSKFDEHLSLGDCASMSNEFRETVHQIMGDISHYPAWIHHYHSKSLETEKNET